MEGSRLLLVLACLYAYTLVTCNVYAQVEAPTHRQTESSELLDYETQEQINTESVVPPRIDYDQWRPVGRGDPLKNDPTYDYVPPVLEKVHYWIDPTLRKKEIPTRPEKAKSEVLVLGVSSKKPSIHQHASNRKESLDNLRNYMLNPKKHNYNPYNMQYRPIASHKLHHPNSNAIYPTFYKNKYEDHLYKLEDHRMPMTILVPPPPPAPQTENLYSSMHLMFQQPVTTTESSPMFSVSTMNEKPPQYSFQEANLIYQSSSITEDFRELWNDNSNYSITHIEHSHFWPESVSETSGLNENDAIKTNNQTYNFINFDASDQTQPDQAKVPGFDYLITESPMDTFIPTTTELTQAETTQETNTRINGNIITIRAVSQKDSSQYIYDYGPTTEESSEVMKIYPYDTTLNKTTEDVSNKNSTGIDAEIKQPTIKPNVLAMISPMIDLTVRVPLDNAESFLTAYKQESPLLVNHETQHEIQGEFDSYDNEDDQIIQTMQTMQPPPIISTLQSLNQPNPNAFLQNLLIKETTLSISPNFEHSTKIPLMTTQTSTTVIPYTVATDTILKHSKQPKDSVPSSMFVIIQGHSKVKTYGSKKKATTVAESEDSNEINKKEDLYPVRHLHGFQNANVAKNDNLYTQHLKSARSLNELIDDGIGSIDIEEAGVGIKYDVSDGSDVPVDVYHKGFVEDEKDFHASRLRVNNTNNRYKRQIKIEDLLPINVNKINKVDEYVYDYIKSKSEGSGVGAILASAITSDAAGVVDDIEDDYDNIDISEAISKVSDLL